MELMKEDMKNLEIGMLQNLLHYELLRKHDLIETRTGKGINLTVRGVKFVRWSILGAGDTGTNGVPKNTSGDKKSPYVPPQNDIDLTNFGEKR